MKKENVCLVGPLPIRSSSRWLVLRFWLSSDASPATAAPARGLSGEQINTPVTDWAVTNAFQDCFIETATWYAIPHSVKLWCAEHAGDVYVGSYGEGSRTWEKHVVRNGDGALRVDGKIYGGRFELVKDPKLTEGIVQSYTEKYSSNELWEVTLTEDGLPPDWRFYRLSQGG